MSVGHVLAQARDEEPAGHQASMAMGAIIGLSPAVLDLGVDRE